MTQEDKELLLKDLCARLPYGVKAKVLDEDIFRYDHSSEEDGFINGIENLNDGLFVIKCREDNYVLSYDEFKPYLRPMSSMTDEEKEELRQEHIKDEKLYAECLIRAVKGDRTMRGKVIIHYAMDWCNKNHFDYRGLIEKGLAIDATGKNIYIDIRQENPLIFSRWDELP